MVRCKHSISSSTCDTCQAFTDFHWTFSFFINSILTADLTPNLGLWWYFFMEIFDHFRDFFLLTFNVHLACYVLPFSIKYR